MSQGKIFNDKSIQSLNAILRKLPDLGTAEINYLIDRLTAMKRDVAPPAD
mgnify:CR=1 FL=1